MYKINKKAALINLSLRGNILSKKLFKKNSKQTLIYLRAPKHFNIGKHKILSFVNFYKKDYKLNNSIPYLFLIKNKSYFYNIFTFFHKFNFIFNITSLKIKNKIKIKF